MKSNKLEGKKTECGKCAIVEKFSTLKKKFSEHTELQRNCEYLSLWCSAIEISCVLYSLYAYDETVKCEREREIMPMLGGMNFITFIQWLEISISVFSICKWWTLVKYNITLDWSYDLYRTLCVCGAIECGQNRYCSNIFFEQAKVMKFNVWPISFLYTFTIRLIWCSVHHTVYM